MRPAKELTENGFNEATISLKERATVHDNPGIWRPQRFGFNYPFPRSNIFIFPKEPILYQCRNMPADTTNLHFSGQLSGYQADSSPGSAPHSNESTLLPDR